MQTLFIKMTDETERRMKRTGYYYCDQKPLEELDHVVLLGQTKRGVTPVVGMCRSVTYRENAEVDPAFAKVKRPEWTCEWSLELDPSFPGRVRLEELVSPACEQLAELRGPQSLVYADSRDLLWNKLPKVEIREGAAAAQPEPEIPEVQPGPKALEEDCQKQVGDQVTVLMGFGAAAKPVSGTVVSVQDQCQPDPNQNGAMVLVEQIVQVELENGQKRTYEATSLHQLEALAAKKAN